MIEKLTKLIDVKSIITILSFGVFSYLAIVGKIEPKDFMAVLMMIATFYFAKKEKDN